MNKPNVSQKKLYKQVNEVKKVNTDVAHFLEFIQENHFKNDVSTYDQFNKVISHLYNMNYLFAKMIEK